MNIPITTTRVRNKINNNCCYMANPVLGKPSPRHIPVQYGPFPWKQSNRFHGNSPTVSMETVQSVYFSFGAKLANSTFATKTAKEKCENCHSSHWNYQQKLKRLRFFQNFRWMKKTNMPREVHFIIRNRVPYNKLLTNWACSGRTMGILALGGCCTDLAALGPHCHNLKPIFPSTALALG